MPSPNTLARLKSAVGAQGFTEDPAEIAPHLEEWRGKYRGQTSLLLKPANTQEVCALLAICTETKTAIVPQGGNTGLVGGQIPFHGEVLLSLARMNRIRNVDAEGMNLIAEGGTILDTIHKAADDAQRLFPLSLASQGSCTIGGNLSTNAGGVDVLRYGHRARVGAWPRSGAGRWAACSTCCAPCARTIRVTTSNNSSSARKARSASSPPPR